MAQQSDKTLVYFSRQEAVKDVEEEIKLESKWENGAKRKVEKNRVGE